MKKVGEALKAARLSKKYTLERLGEETKIKPKFIKAIEEGRWGKLPARPVVGGFVKNLAALLGLDRDKMLALLRRDYPAKSVMVNPKPDVVKRIGWSPRVTFVLGVGGVVVMVLGYLGYQYANFSAAPKLEVDSPVSGEVVRGESMRVVGRADMEVSVIVNNQPVYLNEEGVFNEEIEVDEGMRVVEVKAISRAGRETKLEIPIEVEIK